MKRNHLIYLLILSSFFDLQAQADCNGPTLTQTVLTDNFRTRIGPGGGIWQKPFTFSPQINQDEEVHVLFTGGLWLGGIDPNGNLKLAASTFGFYSNIHDYFPGPIPIDGEVNYSHCLDFEHFWKITKTDIEAFQEDLSDGNLEEFHTNIMRWPAKGNPFFQDIFGFSLPPQDLAPFVDQNGDGYYNPSQGDFPAMKGDQATWWVINDLGNEHAESGGMPLGAEIQIMAYSFDNLSENLSNTQFYDLKIINRSDTPLDSVYAALFLDPDLGCYTDDYYGCNPEENLAFVYNEDAVDGTVGCSCDSGINSFCEEIPLFGIKVVNSPYNGQWEKMGMTSFMVFNNDGGFPVPPPPQNDQNLPDLPNHFYTYMKGLWKDSTAMTYGGSGYMSGGEPTSYAFPSYPNDSDGWSMCTANLPAGDKKMVLGSGPSELAPGKAIELTYAFLYVPDVPHPCPDVTPLIEAGREAQEVFNQVTSSREVFLSNSQISVFPNPMTNSTTIRLSGQSIEHINLFNAQGQMVKTISNLNANEVEIRRQNLEAGIYFYKVFTKEGLTASGKLILQ